MVERSTIILCRSTNAHVESTLWRQDITRCRPILPSKWSIWMAFKLTLSNVFVDCQSYIHLINGPKWAKFHLSLKRSIIHILRGEVHPGSCYGHADAIAVVNTYVTICMWRHYAIWRKTLGILGVQRWGITEVSLHSFWAEVALAPIWVTPQNLQFQSPPRGIPLLTNPCILHIIWS